MQDSTNTDSFLGPRLREGAFIGVSAVCLYLLMALITYSASDPGWSATGSGAKIANLGGPTGAWLADVFFSLVGYAAYLFPLLLAYRAFIILLERHQDKGFDWLTFGIRALGLVLVMIAGTALAAMNDTGSSGLPQGAGGILGQAIGDAFTLAFSAVGSRLILLAVFLFGMTIFTDLSWLTLMDKTGSGAIAAFTRCRNWVLKTIEAFRDKREREKAVEARKVVITEHVEKEKKRKPPKIKPLKAKAEKSDRVEKEKQQPLFEAPVTGALPHLELLDEEVKDPSRGFSKEALESMSKLLELKLLDFGVTAEVTAVYPGPVITRFEIQPAAGVKVSRISNLAKDLARSLAVISVRVVEVIPGKSVVGIEIPNEDREIVNFREVLSSQAFEQSKSPLTLALGHDISGLPVVADLAKMPHLLVAGTTGSGKSVGVNSMLLSLLYKSGPADVRLILVDPKMLELSVYDGIPHLLSPVVTDPKKAVVALKWVVGEMEERYRKMSKMGVRNIDGFNGRVKDALGKNEMFSRTVQTGFDDETGDPIFETEEFQPELLPYIVVIVDEMADLMMVAGKEIEACIQRLAQMARASGIHLIMATQRPSVDVITGTIKANFPTRISFQVTSKIDSRTILGEMGAEQLLGMGDMLYMAGGSKITRVHGPFVSDEEVEEIVNHLKGFGPPEYMSGVVEGPAEGSESSIDLVLGLGDGSDSENALYDTAVAIVIKDRKCSTSYIQRKLAIGYNKAAKLVEQMEDEGVVSSANHVGKREILVPEQH